MSIRSLLGAIGLSVALWPAAAWPGSTMACRESCGEQAEHTFSTCLQNGRSSESCEGGAHDAFASCVASHCEMSTEESCAARCDGVGAEVRAHCLEESGVLTECEELGEAARGSCAEEQC